MENRKYQNFLIFACFFIWIMMMGSKNVYTAEIVELQEIFSVGKQQVAMAMTYYFITYSIAQVILFFFMEKIDIKWFLGLCIFLSGIVTVLVAFVTGMWQIWWLLSLNGILQAGVWGMCLAVLKRYLPEERLPFANTVMNVGMAVGGVISYGFAAVFVGIDMWNTPYIILGAILSVSAIVFFIAVYLCEKHVTVKKSFKSEIEEEHQPIIVLKSKTAKTIFLIVSFVLSFFIHSVFYGTMNWLPDLMTEVHGLESHFGILISVLAPIATILGAVISIYHCEKYSNFIAVSVVYLAIGTALSLAMIFIFDISVILSLVVLVAYLVIFQGTISIVFAVLPLKMSGGISSGGLGCLMNAAGGFAAGFAPMIVGSIIETSGWQISYVIVFIITIALFIALLATMFLLNKNKKKA
ncbi:MAG: MFS transporter [Clostridiales bacterium]|nr:MFS transporter [Clostridiales bacterium]